MTRFLPLLLLFFAFPAFAQEGVPPECRILSEHKPSADVTYRPGVDVRGKAVVPADLQQSAFATDNIVVPLTVDLADRLRGMNVPGLNLETTLGFLEIGRDGRVTYNGQDLTSQIHVLCEGMGDLPPAAAAPAPTPAPAPQQPPKPPAATDRQTPPDSLKYAPVKEIKPVPVVPPAASAPVPAAPQGELIEGGEYAD